MEWQPIETAPKDGTEILIYEPSYLGVDSGKIYTASWDCDCYNTWIEAGGERYMSFDNATHWMPLPSPPAS